MQSGFTLCKVLMSHLRWLNSSTSFWHFSIQPHSRYQQENIRIQNIYRQCAPNRPWIDRGHWGEQKGAYLSVLRQRSFAWSCEGSGQNLQIQKLWHYQSSHGQGRKADNEVAGSHESWVRIKSWVSSQRLQSRGAEDNGSDNKVKKADVLRLRIGYILRYYHPQKRREKG